MPVVPSTATVPRAELVATALGGALGGRPASASADGRTTPKMRWLGWCAGRYRCCSVRRARAEAVLQARITSGQPEAKRNSTASRVNS